MPEKRVVLSARISPGGKGWLDIMAQATGASSSAAVRAALKVAAKYEREVVAILKEQL